ncbi:regulator of nonsense transcripts UPF3 [Typha angustifolia]|uniref:regulator of nonsense transcripts UPF3 n=1 Tax=Typha angustifolia TaxID=59011 RepID=UPI003C2F21B0
MKDPLDRTKVVLRHLPPSISQQALMEQIDGRFAGRYDWACFRPGRSSYKNQRYSRVYLNFRKPEDVVEFADFFNGHVFVNEKGTQFKALVEYAPSQRVPKSSLKKDGREGTILKDPEFLEFLELLAKPVENLPSAEIQLERKEAERAAAGKEAPVVTPLMVFVRQNRAFAKSGAKRSGSSRLSKRATGITASSMTPSKRGSEKRRISTSTYVLREGTKSGSSKEKQTYILVPRREELPLKDKTIFAATSSATESVENEIGGSNGSTSGTSGAVEAGKSRIVLLRGKEKESSHASGGLPQQQNVSASVRSSPASTSKQDHRPEASGRFIRSILSNKEMRQGHSYTTASQPDLQTVSLEKDKRPPRPPNMRSMLKHHISENEDKRHLDEKLNTLHGSVSISEKHDKRTRNRDKTDHGVWTFRRSERSHSNSGTLSSSSDSVQMLSDSIENELLSEQAAGHGEIKSDITGTSRREENGSHRLVSRRGATRGSKEAESSLSISEGKHSKRGPTGYGTHERQVWVQKSG